MAVASAAVDMVEPVAEDIVVVYTAVVVADIVDTAAVAVLFVVLLLSFGQAAACLVTCSCSA